MPDLYEHRSPSADEVEGLAVASFEALPETFKRLCGELVFLIEEFPSDEILQAMGLESPYDLLGLFEGLGVAELGAQARTGQMPNRITLYRRPILDYWAEHDETLGHLVNHVLIHEIGHHFGLSDEDMEALEAAADHNEA